MPVRRVSPRRRRTKTAKFGARRWAPSYPEGMGRASSAKRERRAVEQARRRAHLARTKQALARGCLVCRRSDGGFQSQEHIFPESIGNRELILPNGVVCDRCNNGALSVLDQTICEFLPVMVRRTMLGVPSKAGPVPVTRLTTGIVEHTGPASIRFVAHDGAEMVRETARSGDQVRLEFDMKGGRRMTPRYGSDLSRALLKAALELSWLDHGATILEPQFDHLRAAVLGEPRNGFFAVSRAGNPKDETVRLTYNFAAVDESTWRVGVLGEYFGVAMITDSYLAAPPRDLSDHAEVVTFEPTHWKRARVQETWA